jgi:hypothetical protein
LLIVQIVLWIRCCAESGRTLYQNRALYSKVKQLKY